MKKIVLAALSDLTHDQRMMRIADSLSSHGYKILLVGKKAGDGSGSGQLNYQLKSIRCLFTRGKLYYFEFNLKLFFYLLFQKMDCICAVDLDTIITCYWISRWKKCRRVYDAHEFFSEQKEVLRRPRIQRFWKRIEAFAIPRFQHGYTVSESIARNFRENYGVDYTIIRNLPILVNKPIPSEIRRAFIYQGAINEARGLECLVKAMPFVNVPVWLYGDGNFRQELEILIRQNRMEKRILLRGRLSPEQLRRTTPEFHAGLNLVEPFGLNQYYSLANKFFDYIQAEIPQVTMNFPEYAAVNREFEVAVLIDDLEPQTIAGAMNRLLTDESLYRRLKANCEKAKKLLNWEAEEQKLISFYHQCLA